MVRSPLRVGGPALRPKTLAARKTWLNCKDGCFSRTLARLRLRPTRIRSRVGATLAVARIDERIAPVCQDGRPQGSPLRRELASRKTWLNCKDGCCSRTLAAAAALLSVAVAADAFAEEEVNPAQVYQAVEQLAANVDLVREVMGRPELTTDPWIVVDAQPRHVVYQAMTLHRKANWPSSELVGAARAGLLPALGDEIDLGTVLSVVQGTTAGRLARRRLRPGHDVTLGDCTLDARAGCQGRGRTTYRDAEACISVPRLPARRHASGRVGASGSQALMQ